MAFKRFVIDGYSQLELNQVAFRRDGRVEAQCALDDTDFASVPAENGMLLAVTELTERLSSRRVLLLLTARLLSIIQLSICMMRELTL